MILIYLILVAVYLVIGTMVARVLRDFYKSEWLGFSDMQRGSLLFLGVVFWPILLVIVLVRDLWIESKKGKKETE